MAQPDMTTDEKYMRAALKQAEKAYNLGETPIGCVIVHEDKIIARGYNRRNTDKNPLAPAEVAAIKTASNKLGDWRLEECTLYVTLEPCQMCAGAIVQSRIARVVVGCMNPKAGCTGSILNLLDIQAFNHQADLTTGVLEEHLEEVAFKALPKDLVDKIEVNVGDMHAGDTIKVKYLDIAKNPEVTLSTDPEALIVSVTEVHASADDEEAEDGETAEA